LSEDQLARPAGTNFLFVGVGGQGILTASDITAEVGLAAGLDAKKSEIHGFSQRGGVVESHVRWGKQIGSPMGEKGAINYLVSFEILEAARFIEWLKPGGVVVSNTQKLIPMSVSSGGHEYPGEQEIERSLRSRTDQIVLVEALEIAQRLGNSRLVNTVVLGALSTHLEIEPDCWLEVIVRRVPPRYAELNRKAFWEGRRTLA
jgi:indolepyruvate ferredoxin oxidoreductase beta subunit